MSPRVSLRSHRARLGAALLLVAVPAFAAALTVTKTSQTVSDPMGNLLPKAVPGAVVDYTVMITNPLANSLTTVAGVTFTDAIPTNTDLRVSDLPLLTGGPVVFTDGLVPPTTLSYTFTSFANTTDSIDFSADGKPVTDVTKSWTYQPTADANGYDRNVTHIRVRMIGTQTAGSSFSLRFRVRLR